MRRKNRVNNHISYNVYDLELKKSVVIFAEQNGNKEAHAHYGISEANIRRWRRLKHDLFNIPFEYDRSKLRTRKTINYQCKYEKNSCESVDQESQSSLDSIPLQERLGKDKFEKPMAVNQQTLKSQPLSPTKLKVTRQGVRIKPPPRPPSPTNEEMCLRWNSHHSNMQTAFPNILSKEQYVDCTLAAEGKTLKCHRLILSSCSPYFEEILSGISPVQHPVLFMRDIPYWILKSLCDFMYAGEVHICQDKLEELLAVAEALKIKGLAGKSSPPDESTNKKVPPPPPPQQRPPPPPSQLKRNPMFNTNLNNYESSSHFDGDNDDLLDPLDLLEPLYEEAAEEKKPATIVKTKDNINKYQQYPPAKKGFAKKLRKRKFTDPREPSPPPVFSFRKGTRSRPNVKIPKYYDSDYNVTKSSVNNTQNDPLLDVDEIKTEPIDVEDNNLIDYSDEENDFFENSPIIITRNDNNKFKKIKLSKPIITDVHTIKETNTTPGGLEVIKITVQQPLDNMATEGGSKSEEVIEEEVALPPLPPPPLEDDVVVADTEAVEGDNDRLVLSDGLEGGEETVEESAPPPTIPTECEGNLQQNEDNIDNNSGDGGDKEGPPPPDIE